MISTVKRATLTFRAFLTSFICTTILFFIWDQSKTKKVDFLNSLGVIIVVFVFRFVISLEVTIFWTYQNECFPTQVRVLGSSLLQSIGGLTVTIAPILIELCIRNNFPVMLIFASLSIICMVLSKRLPETLGRKI